jgi:hypothetical protein
LAAVLKMHWDWCGLDGGVASYYSVRLWLMRLGLYQLNRPKTRADDWMWIVDHTMQLGERKCLIIVAVRQSAWDAEDRVLSHENVELIDLVPVTESNGEVVFRQLKAAVAKTGVPRAITSDNGPDLHRGIALFREKYPATAWLYDIKHKTACLLKHALERDSSRCGAGKKCSRWLELWNTTCAMRTSTPRRLKNSPPSCQSRGLRRRSGFASSCWSSSNRVKYWSRLSAGSNTSRESEASTV